MKRAKWLMLFLLLVCAAAWGQVVSSVSISTSVPGPTFLVDGQAYNSSQLFLWPQGSKHIIQFVLDTDGNGHTFGYQSGGGGGIRWQFSGWADNQGLLGPASAPLQTITADPSITSFVASVSTEYLLGLYFPNHPQDDVNCSGAPSSGPQLTVRLGLVYVNGTCHDADTQLWLSPGTVMLNAFPYPGLAFAGFSVNGAGVVPYLASFELTGPTTVMPDFVPAKRVEFRTNPVGLSVVVDHTIFPTPSTSGAISYFEGNCVPSSLSLSAGAPADYVPLCSGDFDFLPGSSHQVGATTPQKDANGNYWIFSGFGNGLTQNSTYVADQNTDVADMVVANFVPGVPVTLFTQPSGLMLQVDGHTTPTTRTFVWAAGEMHQITAPQNVVDAQGRSYHFVQWNNGGTASQAFTVPADATTLWATYAPDAQVQITSVPSGLTLTADGANCVTPCTLNRPAGTQITVSAPTTISNSPTSRYDFDSWNPGGADANMQVTFTAGAQSITANYHASYVLAAASNPSGAATFAFDPPSRDGFYPFGTKVTITASPKTGYKFKQWSGDYGGNIPIAVFSISASYSVTAEMTQIPVTPTLTIMNAAGPTPDNSVAPGSLISIFGDNLAGDTIIGDNNPLRQSLQGVSVTAGNLFFPLWFVSQKQINAQVPWELAPGTYPISVHWAGHPDTNGQIVVSRNAATIYETQAAPNPTLAVAVHQDWTLITPASPARRGEYITIYVNGLGPLDHASIDGYPTPIAPLYAATDKVTVNIGDSLTLTPYWAGAAPQFNGTDVVILQIGDSIPSKTTVDLSITVNGKTSSVAKLPVQ